MPSCVNNGVSVQEAGAENEEVYKEKIMLVNIYKMTLCLMYYSFLCQQKL